MKKTLLLLGLLLLTSVLVFSFACASKEPTQKEKERKAVILDQLKNAPAGSFIKHASGTFVIRDNIDKGKKIFIIMWGGHEEVTTTEILVDHNIQVVIPPSDPGWCMVAKEYLPHEAPNK
ncbi:MAG: hypothetical protein WCX17_04085 [Parcubacteria group bacterium]|jgi:hypothetical protein